MYSQLITLIGCATEYLAIHSDDLAVCQETIKRIGKVAKAYEVESLNFNSMCLFYYQAAIVCCMHGEKEQSLELLGKYVKCMEIGFAEKEIRFHGDDYFNNLERGFDKLEFNGGVPRANVLMQFSTDMFTVQTKHQYFESNTMATSAKFFVVQFEKCNLSYGLLILELVTKKSSS